MARPAKKTSGVKLQVIADAIHVDGKQHVNGQVLEVPEAVAKDLQDRGVAKAAADA